MCHVMHCTIALHNHPNTADMRPPRPHLRTPDPTPHGLHTHRSKSAGSRRSASYFCSAAASSACLRLYTTSSRSTAAAVRRTCRARPQQCKQAGPGSSKTVCAFFALSAVLTSCCSTAVLKVPNSNALRCHTARRLPQTTSCALLRSRMPAASTAAAAACTEKHQSAINAPRQQAGVVQAALWAAVWPAVLPALPLPLPPARGSCLGAPAHAA